MEKAILKAFPDEVQHVWSRIGSAEIATDPMGVELTDMYVALTPREKWKRASAQDELTELLEKELPHHAGPEDRLRAAHRDAHERDGNWYPLRCRRAALR